MKEYFEKKKVILLFGWKAYLFKIVGLYIYNFVDIDSNLFKKKLIGWASLLWKHFPCQSSSRAHGSFRVSTTCVCLGRRKHWPKRNSLFERSQKWQRSFLSNQNECTIRWKLRNQTFHNRANHKWKFNIRRSREAGVCIQEKIACEIVHFVQEFELTSLSNCEKWQDFFFL